MPVHRHFYSPFTDGSTAQCPFHHPKVHLLCQFLTYRTLRKDGLSTHMATASYPFHFSCSFAVKKGDVYLRDLSRTLDECELRLPYLLLDPLVFSPSFALWQPFGLCLSALWHLLSLPFGGVMRPLAVLFALWHYLYVQPAGSGYSPPFGVICIAWTALRKIPIVLPSFNKHANSNEDTYVFHSPSPGPV